jgi:hypothetical protein
LSATKKIIFRKSARIPFYEILDKFHENFVDCFLLTGVTKNNADLEEIPFTKHPDYSLDFYKILVGGLKKFKPSLVCRLQEEKYLELECLYYNFGEYEGENQVYMIQNVMNWTNKNDFCCQVCNLSLRDIDLIETFWTSSKLHDFTKYE